MAARSTIAQLPRELADLCHRLIREGKTIHAITDKLNELDADVSKSAVGRYVKSARENMARHLEAQQVAGIWTKQLAENPSGDVSALLADMLKTIAFQALGTMSDAQSEEGGKGKPKPMDILLLAKTIESLEGSAKKNIERRLQERKRTIEDAAEKTSEVGNRLGISQASIDEIQRELRLL